MSAACSGTTPLEPLGAPECSENTVPTSPSERYCRRQKSCWQHATLLGTEVRSLTGNLVDCSRRDDGSWSCSCSYARKDEDYVRSELEADDSESACAEGIAHCPLVSTIY
jgi:hypothetical protein